MKIVLFSESEKESNKEIIEAGKKRGHTVTFVRPSDCSFFVKKNTFEVFHKNRTFPQCDAILPRNSFIEKLNAHFLLLILENVMYVKCFNTIESILIARDKIKTLQILVSNNIPILKTGLSFSENNIKHIIEQIGENQQMIKLPIGSMGVGTILTNTPHETHSIFEILQQLEKNPFIQECSTESLGKSIRCVVINNKVVASVKFEANNGDFRYNNADGNNISSYIPTKQERAIAIKSAQAIGLDFTAVDMVRSQSGPKVLELNSSSAIIRTMEATGIDIADLMIQHIEKKVGKKS